MTFRDPAGAAQARAEALADALAERDAEIEQLRARLAEQGEALRGVQEKAASLLEADRDLKEIASRGERAKEEATRKKAEEERARRQAELRQKERARTERRRSSVSWGDFLPLAMATPPAIGALATFYLSPAVSMLVGISAVIIVTLLVAHLGFERSDRRRVDSLLQREEAWARSHPHELIGYPDLLEAEIGYFGTLTLEIQLRDPEGASELEAILRGFDLELTAMDPSQTHHRRRGPRDRAGAPGEAAPPTGAVRFQRQLKEELSSNRALRRWVHRLHEEILTRLHARYGVIRVIVG